MDKTKLKNGDILLVHHNGFDLFDVAIRHLTGSFWNHCAMYVSDGVFIEAEGNGVIRTAVDFYYGNPKYQLKLVRVKQEVFKDNDEYIKALDIATAWIKNQVGEKYDWFGVIGVGIRILLHASWPDNPLQNRNEFFCSELDSQAFSGTSSISKYPNIFAGNKFFDCATMTPHDIAKSDSVAFVDGVDYL